MVLEVEPKSWYRDEFLISTEYHLLQLDAIRDAMNSEVVWWTQAPPTDALVKSLQNSLCLGLYELPQSTSQIAERPQANRAGKVDHRWCELRVPH
ncbi:hypothetical protein F4825DRAFT_447429 [Nemania diffusa]|nr:hypothetical protein F4825DRAFT_447429 [Nemania diffusa]